MDNTLQIYVKNCTNCPDGMSLTSYELLSEVWSGDSITLPFLENAAWKHYEVVGWTDNLFNNPYPDVVRGCPDLVYCAKVRSRSEEEGYLVWGGNYGLRINGRDGWGQAVLWLEYLEDLPKHVQHTVLYGVEE